MMKIIGVGIKRIENDSRQGKIVAHISNVSLENNKLAVFRLKSPFILIRKRGRSNGMERRKHLRYEALFGWLPWVEDVTIIR